MSGRWLALVALFLAATVWGVAFVLVKDILPMISTERFIFWRFLVGGLILVVLSLRFRQLSRDQLGRGFWLGLLVFAGYWLQTRGLAHISPSRSAFLTGLAVVMVPLFDWAIHRTVVSPFALVSTLLAATGTFFLVGGVHGVISWADVMTILCAVIFALHLVFSARFSRGTGSLGLAAVQVLTVALISLPLMARQSHPAMSRTVVLTILFTGIVTTAMTFWVLTWSQARLTATEAAVILAFEPVAAYLTSLISGHDRLNLSFVFGASLILFAMLMSQWRPGSGRSGQGSTLTPEGGTRTV